MNGPPRFIADEMNGDVARWLRIMGFDCIYITGIDMDRILLKTALETQRILLTGDRELYRKVIRKGGEAIYTRGSTLEEKFRSIVEKVNLNEWIGKLPYRCSICNGELIRKKSKDLDITPKYIKERFDYVWYCPKCNKVYWEGSHWEKIKKRIENIMRLGK